MKLLLKVIRVVFSGIKIRFTWCSAHIGIEGNELVDICAKSANLSGVPINNLVAFKELMCYFKRKYKTMDFDFIDNISRGTDAYYMNYFRDTNIKFIEKLAYKRREYTILIRVISGYANTKDRMFKMKLVDSPACDCGFAPQDLNHLFWACLLLGSQRKKLYQLLRQKNMQDPFFVEYLLGNINKSIASVICKFILINEKKLNIRI